jgi:hypothetical protein
LRFFIIFRPSEIYSYLNCYFPYTIPLYGIKPKKNTKSIILEFGLQSSELDIQGFLCFLS